MEHEGRPQGDGAISLHAVMRVQGDVAMLTATVAALEQVVLGTLDPVQQERFHRQVEENLKVLLEGKRPGRPPG